MVYKLKCVFFMCFVDISLFGVYYVFFYIDLCIGCVWSGRFGYFVGMGFY